MTHQNEVIPAIVEAIAEAEGCQPHALNLSLYNHIDTDALSTLVAGEQTDWQLTIQVPGHSVEIRGDGQIRVDDTVYRQVESAQHSSYSPESDPGSDQ